MACSTTLRVGYFPDDIRDVLASIRPPFSVNSIASHLGVIALKDTEFQEASIAHNEKWLSVLPQRFADIGIKMMPTTANFFLLHFDGHNGPDADSALRFLADKNILLRDMHPYGLDDYLRMSIGTDEEMDIVLSAFEELMSESS